MPNDYDLLPVEGNPFQDQGDHDLVAVDHDPFSAADIASMTHQAPQPSPTHPGYPNWMQPETQAKVGLATAEALGDVVAAPVRAANELWQDPGQGSEFGRQPDTLRDWEMADAQERRAANIGTLAGAALVGAMPAAEEGALGALGGKGITAYHGSPHDFERFDISKIGTGEGAQSYGHGLYFAENPKVAQEYKAKLGPVRGKLPDDVISLPPEMRQAVQAHADTDADPMTAAKRAQYMSSALRTRDQNDVADMIQRVRDAKAGKMYEANINADPEHFLDWDKPLAEQPHILQNAPHLLEAAKNEAYNRAIASTNKARADQLWDIVKDPTRATGEFAIRGSGRASDPDISARLRDAGIPGVRYLDQGSRNSGAVTMTTKYRDARIDNGSDPAERFLAARFKENDGDINKTIKALSDDLSIHPNRSITQKAMDLAQAPDAKFNLDRSKQTRNYVMFDDKLIDIVKKYGWAGLMAAGANHFSEPTQDQAPARAHGGRVIASNINHRPTPAQIEAGNYQKEHIHKFGLPITIENAKGSIRRGTGKDGKPWQSVLPAHYGYIKRSVGADGDHVDVYLGPHPRASHVYVVDQVDAETKKFDEHKAMLGFGTERQAIETYKRGFSDGRGAQRIGRVTSMRLAQFRDWLDHGDQGKPFSHVASRQERVADIVKRHNVIA